MVAVFDVHWLAGVAVLGVLELVVLLLKLLDLALVLFNLGLYRAKVALAHATFVPTVPSGSGPRPGRSRCTARLRRCQGLNLLMRF